MSDFYLDHYLFDNSKIYLQDGDKPPKGAIVHKGPKDGRYYDPDERPVQYVHISPERRTFLSWLDSQGSNGLNVQKDIEDLPDEVTYKRGYRDRFEIGKEILALEKIGVIYRDGDIYRISDEGKQAISQDGEIGVIDRVKREEQLKRSPFRIGKWEKQDLKGLTKYVNVPTFGLTEKYPPNTGGDLAEYIKFKTAGLVDHQPYIYYIMDEVIEHSYSDNEILKYCRDNSDRFDEIYTKEGRAYVMDELRKAHDAIRMNRHSELDLSSPVVQALIMDDVIVRNRSERIVLTEAGEKALKEGSYTFSLPKTQISQSITDEAMLGLDKSQFPVSNYFLSTNTDITPIEMRSIIEYKGNWYDAVNQALLRGTEPIQEETNNMIACLDNLLSRSVIKEACTLYNGCPTEVSNMMLSGEFSAGDILQLDTFTSTSLDREVAGMFSNNDVILKIEQPANSTGFFYGTEETEQEVLLPRGTQLRIKEIRKVPRFHEFYGGLEKDGSLTWDTLTDDEKDQALDDGYSEVPTKERNFDTLSPEEQGMMGKTIVVCERISGKSEGVTVDTVKAAIKSLVSTPLQLNVVEHPPEEFKEKYGGGDLEGILGKVGGFTDTDGVIHMPEGDTSSLLHEAVHHISNSKNKTIGESIDEGMTAYISKYLSDLWGFQIPDTYKEYRNYVSKIVNASGLPPETFIKGYIASNYKSHYIARVVANGMAGALYADRLYWEDNFTDITQEKFNKWFIDFYVRNLERNISSFDPFTEWLDQRERIQADNSYQHYLTGGEQPRPGETVHIGERDGRYVIREYNPSEKIKEVGKQSVLKYTGDIDKELLKKIADAKGTFEGNGWKDTFHSMYKAGLITTDGKTIQITDDGLSVLESNSPSVAVLNRLQREETLMNTPLRDKSYYYYDVKDYFLTSLVKAGGIGEYKDYRLMSDIMPLLIEDGVIEANTKPLENNTKLKITELGRKIVYGTLAPEDFPKKPDNYCGVNEEWGHQDGNITDMEREYIKGYKDVEYASINQILLTNMDDDYENFVEKIAHLDNIIERCALTESSVVYEGSPSSVGKMLASGDVKAGDLFQLDTYTSTSLNTDQANRFLNPVEIPGKGIYSVRLEIHQPAGSTGFFFGRGDSEEEVLLPRSTQIRIKSIEFTDEDAPTMPSSKLVKVVCERISGIKEMQEVRADNSKVYLQGDEKPPKGVPVYKGPQDGRYYNTEEVPEKQTFTEQDGEKYPWLAVQDRDGEWRISDCRGYPLSGNYEATPADVLQWLQMEPEKRTPAHHHLLEIIAEQSEFDDHDRAEFKLDEGYKGSTLSLSEEEAKKLYQLSLALLEDQHEFLTPYDNLERTEYENPNVYYELKNPIQNPFFDITDTMVENLFDEDEEEYSEEFPPIDGMFYGPVKEPTLPYTWMLAIGESLSDEYGNTKTPKWDEISQINQILAYTELSSRDAVALENLLQHTSHKLQGRDLSQKEIAEIMVQKEINPTADNIVSDATFNNINNMHPAPKSFDQAQNHLDRYNDLHQKRKDIEEKIQVYLGGPVDISQLKYILYDQGTEILKMKKQLSDIGGYSPELASQFPPVQKLNDDLIALQQKNYEGSSLLTNYTDIMRRENVEKKQYLVKSGAYKSVELIDSQIPSKNTAMSESTIQEACERYGLQDEVVRGHLKDWINGITPFVSRYMWKSIDTLDPEVNPIELTIGDKTRWNEDHVADVCNTMDKLYSVSRLAQDTTIYRGTSFRQVCEMFGVDNYSSRHDELDLNQIKDKEVICPDYTSWTENYDTGFKFAAERVGAEAVWSPEEYELLDPEYDPEDEDYKFKPDLIKMVTHMRFPSDDNTIHLLKVDIKKGDHGIFIGNVEPYYEDEIIMGRGRRYKLWKVTKKPHPIYSNITVVTYELDMIDPNVEANLSGVMI